MFKGYDEEYEYEWELIIQDEEGNERANEEYEY